MIMDSLDTLPSDKWAYLLHRRNEFQDPLNKAAMLVSLTPVLVTGAAPRLQKTFIRLPFA